MRRFLNENISDTLKNVSQELVMCQNIQSTFGQPLAKEILVFIKNQFLMCEEIEQAVIDCKDKNSFLLKIKEKMIYKEFGWFKFDFEPNE